MTQMSQHPNYWSQNEDELFSDLLSSPQGLTSEIAKQNLADLGANVFVSKAKATPFHIFISQFKSPIVLILLFATIVSLFVQEWVDAIIILAIVLGSACLSFYQELKIIFVKKE